MGTSAALTAHSRELRIDAPTHLIAATVLAIVLSALGPLLRLSLRRRGLGEAAHDLGTMATPARVTAAALILRSLTAGAASPWLRATTASLLIASVVWLVLRALRFLEAVVFRRLSIDTADNRRARSRRTQLDLARRAVAVVVIVGGLVVALFTVTPFRSFGPTVVTYAGLIGVIAGVALRASLENLAAGLIVAFSEPVRIDDVVVVDGEWGRIEHLGLVNVVVRIWDDRRLVLPTARFVNEPFENWTREAAAVTGTVTAWVDHRADIDALRSAFETTVEASPHWDGRFKVLQVVDIGERAVQVRGLVTAANAQDAWEVRCEVREALLTHLRSRNHTLPVVRLGEPQFN